MGSIEKWPNSKGLDKSITFVKEGLLQFMVLVVRNLRVECVRILHDTLHKQVVSSSLSSHMAAMIHSQV